MFDFPQAISINDQKRVADWVELCALAGQAGGLSQTDVADFLHDAGLIGTEPTDYFPEDESFLDRDTFAPEDAGERYTEEVWQELATRRRNLLEGYPFRVDRDRIERHASKWQDVPAFTMLLISDIGECYAGLREFLRPDLRTARLFEKVVEASQRGLLRGTTCRFGWPIEPGWPEAIDDRVAALAETMGLDLEDLTGKTGSCDKDRGLDVVGRLSFGDDGAGGLVLLTQCAMGHNWRNKKGEPSIANWQDLLKWDACLVRAVAVPRRLDETFNYRKARRHFDDAIILDRPRLCAGIPDRYLEPSAKQEIIAWCKGKLAKLPRVE